MQPKTVVRVEAEEPAKRLAVLIDADNAQAGVIEGLLEEVARFGEATVRRIYGDFTSPTSASWKKVLNRYSIKPQKITKAFVTILDKVGIKYAILGKEEIAPAILHAGPATNSCSR